MPDALQPRRIRIRKGLDIPIAGAPLQAIHGTRTPSHVALLGIDYVGLRPQLAVQLGERVRLGQTLFTDKSNPGVRFTSPGAGEVVAINRGARRVLQSVVVRLDGDDAFEFDTGTAQGAAAIRRLLVESGLWCAFRTRPFSRIPAIGSSPAALFVTAIDTRPLAPDPVVIIGPRARAFERGLMLLLALGEWPTYLCTAPDAEMPAPRDARLRRVEFSGPHPAGLPGTHIHHLAPAGQQRSVWHIGYQDVIAVGELFTEGRLPTERVVAVAGPMAREPRLLKTRLGAATEDLLAGEIASGPVRVISGSVLSGHRAADPLAWLGRYHDQLSLIAEDRDRQFLAWMRPGVDRYSSLRAYAGKLFSKDPYALTSTQNGSPRAMVPIGSFERVMPLDILPTPLLKALLVEDTDRAKELGCLELDEEDLALCSFVCNGKYEYGAYLRMTLDEIEVNG
jgi:Na+-transporting NADH:ubiquinone oxidoreductase subunit A